MASEATVWLAPSAASEIPFTLTLISSLALRGYGGGEGLSGPMHAVRELVASHRRLSGEDPDRRHEPGTLECLLTDEGGLRSGDRAAGSGDELELEDRRSVVQACPDAEANTAPAVAVRPPVKVSESVVSLPSVVVPVFRKLVAVAMVPPPVSDTA